MSTSSSINASAFIAEMRKMGASRIVVGDVTVEFPDAAPAGPPVRQVDTDPEVLAKLEQVERDKLVYGSSD